MVVGLLLFPSGQDWGVEARADDVDGAGLQRRERWLLAADNVALKSALRDRQGGVMKPLRLGCRGQEGWSPMVGGQGRPRSRAWGEVGKDSSQCVYLLLA